MAAPRDHYLLADDKDLLAECQVHFYRASGPGGQKRNKTSSAVRLRHDPTGLTVVATESRSQHENRARALRRLRMAMALQLRQTAAGTDHAVPAELAEVGDAKQWLVLNGRNPRYPLAVAAVLDALADSGGRVSVAAETLGVSTSRLVDFLRRDPKVWTQANRIRTEGGHSPLR
jgi:hypothetical protein